MKENDLTQDLCPETSHEATCNARRQFLVRAGTTAAGGLLLSLTTSAQDKKGGKMDALAEETILKLDEKSPLNKVGGSQTLETKAGKVIVVRAGEAAFVAYAAVCPHSGGPIKYDDAAKQFSCPWHGSTFGADGTNISGPARRPLTPYATQNAVVIGAKISS